MTIKKALNQANKVLKNKSTSPSLDAEVLLAFVFNKNKEYLLANPKRTLLRNQLRNYRSLLNKRAQGWPVAYLTGSKEFYGLNFIVNKNVLIPRPETEGLVEMILEKVKGQGAKVKILDIGTGSGNIIISLAKNLPGKFFASDVSAKALGVANRNAKIHKVKVTFKQGALLQPWEKQQFDIIVANLPYLPKQTDPSTKFEPNNALVAKKQGLALFEQLFQQISSLSAPPSSLLLEIGHDQGAQIKKTGQQIAARISDNNF